MAAEGSKLSCGYLIVLENRAEPHAGTIRLFVTLAEIRGRCQHPIVSASGGFDGAAGVLMFKDDVSTGIATYTGHVTL